MRNTGYMKHKLESRMLGEISIISDMQITPLSQQKAREFQKNIYFCFIDYAKTLTVCITTNCRQFFKRWEYQTTLSAS